MQKSQALAISSFAALLVASCGGSATPSGAPTGDGTDKILEGQRSFRGDTFGTEGYWSDVVRLGSGLQEAEVTLLDLLRLGVSLDGDADPVLASTLSAELLGDLSTAPTLNDPAAALDALRAGMVVGLVASDVDGDELLDFAGADTLGPSCALCHSAVDGSFYDGSLTGVPGAIGALVDGQTPAALELGDLFALAGNSRALLPYLAQPLSTVGGLVLSRGGGFVDESSTEAEVDAHLRSDAEIPPGTWDLIPDGVGAPVKLPSLFELRRSAPYGAAGAYVLPPDLVNVHLTLGLDPTTLLTTDGTVFMDLVAPGIAAELRGRFETVLLETGVDTPAGGFPFVDAMATGAAGVPSSPVGLRIEEVALGTVAGYLSSAVAPEAPVGDPVARVRGEALYAANCASCHGMPDGQGVLPLISLENLRANHAPSTLLARGFPLTDLRDDTLSSYDDRLVIFDTLFVDNQVPAAPRAMPAPRLDALHLEGRFLHDASVESLEALLDPARGAGAPHPVALDLERDRADVAEFLLTR